ncbi:MAG: N-6 DNA methylase [bacterium]
MAKKINMDESYIDSLLAVLGFQLIYGKSKILKKDYANSSISVDKEKKVISYPSQISIGRETIINFSKPENFVVLECVDSLLTLGYLPSTISLEKSYRGGWIDILIYKNNHSEAPEEFAIIECKTYGKEYDSAYSKLVDEISTPQLFDYAQQFKKVDKLCLYASKVVNNQIEVNHCVIQVSDKMKSATNAIEIRNAWSGIGYETGLFDALPYSKVNQKLKYSALKDISNDTGRKLYNDFATILRSYVVSDKSNAYNKLFNLFLCKIVDEEQSNKSSDPILNFQYIVGENNIEFMKRLNDLYKVGVKDYLDKEITDYSDADFNKLYSNSTELKRMFDELRLFKNGEFSFIEVFNEKSFNQNTDIVKEVVLLLQNYRLKYTHKHTYLGLFFENLLNSGFKQESGQFFTPIPVAKFIVSAIPVKNIIERKLESSKPHFLPYIIDYACGSGHFLTEGMDEVQSIINNYDISNLTGSQKKAMTSYVTNEYSWANEYIYGIDLDYRLVKTTKVSTFLNGDGTANIIHANGLAPFNSEEYVDKLHSNGVENNNFDLLLANPPYSVKNFKRTIVDANNRFSLYEHLGKNSDDIECLFVERMNQVLCDGAYVGIVLPTSILESTKAHTKARKYIIDHFRIVGLVKLSDQAFMKTDTKTVIMFLEKNSLLKDDLDNRVEEFFKDNDHQDFDWGDAQDVMSLCSKSLYNEELPQFIEKLSDYNNGIEKEKICTFIKTYQQRVVVVDAGSKEEAKRFLGYDFTTRRGNEGIQEKYIDSDDHTIDTKLFSVPMSPDKVNYFIYNNFLNKELPNVSNDLTNNLSVCKLSDIISFECEKKNVFNSFILMNKLELDKCLDIKTKYPVMSLSELLPNSVKKGTSITKDQTVNGCYNVVAGGKKPAYKHNVYNREANIITVSASGAGAGYVNYYKEKIFASDCNTIECSDKIMLQYVYYILQYKQSDIYKFAKGNAQPHIYESQIYRFRIPVPTDRAVIEELVIKCSDVDKNVNLKEDVLLARKASIIKEIIE